MKNHFIQRYILIILALFTAMALPAQVQVVMVGNTADASPDFFHSLQSFLQEANEPTVLLVNGDITDGCSHRKDKNADPLANARLLVEVIRATPAIEAYLVPGDRDWDHSGKQGWECVQELEDYLEDEDLANLHWPLDKGCPGPETVELAASTRMIMINTQWWNHPHRKPIPADGECEYIEPSIVLEEIHDEIEENLDKNILLVGHFPVYSQGRYGGKFPVADHLSPPVIGGIKAAYRQNIGLQEDIHNAQYEPFLDKLKELADQYQGLFFLGGHDRNQQVVAYRNNYVISSGAPNKARWVAQHKPAIIAEKEAGFCVLQFSATGEVNYRFMKANKEGLHLEIEQLLYDKPCIDGATLTALPNPNYQPCLLEVDSSQLHPVQIPLNYQVAAGNYNDVSKFYQLFFGKHYRSTWDRKIIPEVLNLETELGGLYPTKRGGGRQTQSLKLETAAGERYVFRSVDKDPAGTLSFELRNTIIADITRDQTSTQQPYGAMIVASLLDEVDILHATPRLFIMSGGPRLGRFNNPFAYMLGMLEERPNGTKKKLAGTFGADKVYKSYELFNERYQDQDLKINYPEFARARLFDILIGDWSKHEDNWKWAAFKQANGDLAVRPIPRDRDHAFSQLDGFFPWLASRRWAVQNLEHFDYEIQDVRSLTFQARHMDRLLMSPLEREDVLAQARFLQAQIGDREVRAAINTLPATIVMDSGNIIGDKLTRRLADLETYANDYYELHAKVVDVVGTNKEEQFDLWRLPDGQVKVTVSDRKGSQAGRILYDRTFLPDETKEIRLYGLGDDDRFQLQGNGPADITIRIIGGPGDNELQDRTQSPGGGKSIFIYDHNHSQPMQLSKQAKRVNNWRDELYHYDRTAHAYNTYFPLAYINYNSFNGFQLAGGVTLTRRSFTRRDYSSKHRINGSVGTIGNFSLGYAGEWHHVLRKWDLFTDAQLERPSFYNFFFGIGNNTTKDDDAFRNDFNLVRLSHYHLETGLRRSFWRKSNVELALGYQHSNTTDTENTILDREIPFYGTENLNWAYAQPSLEIDLRDHPVFPSRGVRFQASQEFARGREIEFGVSKLTLEAFHSTRRYPITLALRAGWAASQGDVPFYKLPSLGNNEGLRGFQRNRFVGNGYFYYNTELRCPVAIWRNPVLPVVFGLRGFFDSGFVTESGVDSPAFQHAYGGGFYLIPLSRSYTLSVLLGFSDEESALVNLNMGTNF